jgi:tripeptidyl-peptidase-1
MEPKVNKFTSKRWIQELAPPDENSIVTANFALKHDPVKAAAFEANLISLSTPGSPNYGKWLTREQAIQAISPSEDQVKIVTDFLDSFGVENYEVSAFRDVVKVHMPLRIAEKMLDTKFATFKSVVIQDIKLLRITQPYSLPTEIADAVKLVDDILRFPSIEKKQIFESSSGQDPEFSSCGNECSGFTTPDVLQARYGYSEEPEAVPGNTVSCTEFQFQYYDNTDIDNFNSNCDTSVAIAETIGGNKEFVCSVLGGCVEALLDIEYLGAVTSPIPMTVIYQQEFSLLDWINGVIAMDDPPLVHSVSYGNDEVQQTSSEYMEECNTQFQIAGSMGLSVLFASGDQGVWGRSGVGQTFHPDFPAGSPYITAVGGTNFQQAGVIGNETAWDCGGGGFSDEFPMPDWQSAQVNAYLTNAGASGLLPDASFYNAAGRGYPDMAALGGQTNPYCVAIKGGKFGGVAGTSASCPVVAGIISQLNDLRLKAGNPPLGWLNPALYSNLAGCFYDVDDGSQNNCKKGDGFHTIPGWDPATGLGTPNFECLSGVINSF